MPVRDRDHQILEKIVGYCKDIEFTHNEYNRSYETFGNNPTYRNAVALCLMQIGELTNKLSEGFKDAYAQIPWKAIRGMRNVVAHEYGKIDVETVWETTMMDIPALREFCDKYIAEESNI